MNTGMFPQGHWPDSQSDLTKSLLTYRPGIDSFGITNRLVRDHKWRRGWQRVYPAKLKTAIRATRANEIWHVDMTLIRLLDGSRVYLHAVIDNFSRWILAWQVQRSFHPEVTAQLLLDASKNVNGQAHVVVDGGVENFNKAFGSVVLCRILDRLQIPFRCLKSGDAQKSSESKIAQYSAKLGTVLQCVPRYFEHRSNWTDGVSKESRSQSDGVLYAVFSND